MLKRIGLLILIIVIVILMATFTAINTGTVDIDLAFARIHQATVAGADRHLRVGLAVRHSLHGRLRAEARQ